MPRLLYEYIYVNMWILFFLTLMWTNDGQISVFEGCLLIIISISGIALVAKKQLRTPNSAKFRKPF